MFHREFEFVNLYVSYRFTNTFTFTFTLVHFLKHRSYKLPPMLLRPTLVLEKNSLGPCNISSSCHISKSIEIRSLFKKKKKNAWSKLEKVTKTVLYSQHSLRYDIKKRCHKNQVIQVPEFV